MEAPPSAAENLEVLDEISQIAQPEPVDLGQIDVRERIVAELAESMREPGAAPTAIMGSSLSALKQVDKSNLTDESDDFDLDKLVLTQELTPQVIKILASSVSRGSDLVTACNRHLIDAFRVKEWCVLGDSIIIGSAVADTPHSTLCLKLALALRKASGLYEMRLDEGIHGGGNRYLQFLQIAKLRHPALYGEKAADQNVTYEPNEAYA